MKKLTILLACILAFGLAGTSASTYSGYSWQSPMNIKVIDGTISAVYQTALLAAVADWNQSLYIHFDIVKGDCRNVVNGHAIKVCEYNGMMQCPAHADIWLNHGNVARVWIVVDDICDYSMIPNGEQYVMCHELGHALGLSEQGTDLDSCMTSRAAHPSAGDYEMLASIYGK